MGFSSGSPVLKNIPLPPEANAATVSVVYSQAEINALVNKLNATLQKLRDAGVILP